MLRIWILDTNYKLNITGKILLINHALNFLHSCFTLIWSKQITALFNWLKMNNKRGIADTDTDFGF